MQARKHTVCRTELVCGIVAVGQRWRRGASDPIVAPCPFDLAEQSVSDEEFAAYHGTWNVGARRAGHGQASATPLLNIFAD